MSGGAAASPNGKFPPFARVLARGDGFFLWYAKNPDVLTAGDGQ